MKYMGEMLALIKTIPEDTNRIVVSSRPAMYRFEFIERDKLIIEPEQYKSFQRWVNLTPISFASQRDSWEDIINGRQNSKNAMAKNLIKKGCEVYVSSKSGAAQELAEAGAKLQRAGPGLVPRRRRHRCRTGLCSRAERIWRIALYIRGNHYCSTHVYCIRSGKIRFQTGDDEHPYLWLKTKKNAYTRAKGVSIF